jgi:hypothetical protein
LVFLAGKPANLAGEMEYQGGKAKISAEDRGTWLDFPVPQPKRSQTWPKQIETGPARQRLGRNCARLSEIAAESA